MLFRAVWRGLRTAGWRTPLPTPVLPARHMSFGIPASGTNLAFVVLGGGSLTAALVYAYKTVHSDSMRYNNRISDIEARFKIMTSEAPAGDPAPVAEVTALHAVAEAVVVETVTGKASEGPEPVEEELPVAEATDPTPDAGDAVEYVVAMVVTEAAAQETEAAVAEPAEPAVPVAVETTAVETTVTIAEATAELSAVKEAPAA
ncbi:protein MGARP isoform X2 [Colossoma macropomum]|uniref:protein MGARP isoform X2 n=1 Tax=Colossoma macropomum TaxID=42526 RepID=UPI001864E48B|nr:protein MGARP isoform X2 [Colossoma macropomum]